MQQNIRREEYEILHESTNPTTKSKELPSDTIKSTRKKHMQEIAEIRSNNNTTMAETVKVEVRRTIMTPTGRKFPPREALTIDMTMPFPDKPGQQETGDEFQTLQERVAAGFPRMNGQFVLLCKGEDGTLVPCDNHKEFLKAAQQVNEGCVQLYIQGQSNWEKHGANELQCTNCMVHIHGMRVKCLECDFNLCPQCDEKGIHVNHVMVKCDRPRFFHFALILFTESLPSLCKQVRDSNDAANLPRLSAKEVRQFWQKERKEKDRATQEGGAKRKAVNQNVCGLKRPMHGRRHAEVKCSNCTTQVEGMRSKCLECDDYILCSQCDEQGIHNNHVMVKCDRPRFFNFALPLFVDAIPRLCQEIRNKQSGDEMPRLGPKEVRQFCHEKKSKDRVNQPVESCGEQAEQAMPVLKMKMSGRRQSGVQCNECSSVIQGMRLKCLECADYNLCTQCDENGNHGNHVMVKSDRPRFFIFGLPKFAESIPKLCEELQKDKSDGQVPRVEREYLRQYWRQNKKEEQKGIFLERQQHMRKTWQKFLQDIVNEDTEAEGCDGEFEMVADEEHQSDEQQANVTTVKATTSDHDELTERVENMDLGDSQDKEQAEDKLKQMKGQWMKQCQQEWREQLCQVEEPEQMDRKFRFRMWRPYMRRCWDMWRQQKVEAKNEAGKGQEERDGEDTCHYRGRRGFCHPRRQWIQNCWKLWREEASKKASKWIPDDVSSSDEEEKGSLKQGLFPGYHFLMKKSWEMMVGQSKHAGKGIKSKDAADPNCGDEVEPKVAKHMLKRCWVNGSRQLWWMQARKLLNISELEGDVNNRTTSDEGVAVTQEEMMKLMSDKHNWRSYMQQCWRLWHQLSKKVGLSIKHDAPSSGDEESTDHEAGKPLQPKQAWIKASWPQWTEGMDNSHQEDEKRRPNASRVGKPIWDKRPFAGWHPLITRSWQLMTADTDTIKRADNEVRMDEIRSMRAAWMKEVQKEMKQLSLQKNEDTKADDEHPRAGSQDAVMSTTPRAGPQDDCADLSDASRRQHLHAQSMMPESKQQWQSTVDIQDKLVNQYWQVYRNRKQVQRDESSSKIVGCPQKENRKHWRAQMRHGITAGQSESGELSAKTDEPADGMDSTPHLRLKFRMKKTPANAANM